MSDFVGVSGKRGILSDFVGVSEENELMIDSVGVREKAREMDSDKYIIHIRLIYIIYT